MRNYYPLSNSPGYCLFFTCCFLLGFVWYVFYSCLWCWAARWDCSPGTNAPAFLALKNWQHFQSFLFWFPEYTAGSKLLTVCTVWNLFCWPRILGAWVAVVHPGSTDSGMLSLPSFSSSNQIFIHPFIVNFINIL